MKAAPRTKYEHAYFTLRRAIVVGEIRDGEVLDDVDLMERFDIGRTPLREALKRLALEQLVVWPAHRTPYARGLAATELHDLAEARLAVEVPAARYAAERISSGQLERLEQALQSLRAAEEANDAYSLVELDHQLHTAIATGSNNRFLIDAVGQVNCSSLRLWYVTCSQLGVKGVHARHRPLLSAIRRGDGPAAAEAMKEHIIRSEKRHAAVVAGVVAVPATGSRGRVNLSADAG